MGEHLKLQSVPYKLGGVQKARSVRSFPARLNLTNNPDRSSLVQLYLGSFMWMDLRVLLLSSQEPRNRIDLRQTQNISVS